MSQASLRCFNDNSFKCVLVREGVRHSMEVREVREEASVGPTRKVR